MCSSDLQNSPGVKAIEMSDGDTILDLANPWNGQSRYAFHGSSLSYTSRIGKGVYELEMDAAWPHYPGKFTYEAKNVKIKGKFEKIRAAAPPSPATFRIRAPADAEVVVLEARP